MGKKLNVPELFLVFSKTLPTKSYDLGNYLVLFLFLFFSNYKIGFIFIVVEVGFVSLAP
jgi:hypothetical protein